MLFLQLLVFPVIVVSNFNFSLFELQLHFQAISIYPCGHDALSLSHFSPHWLLGATYHPPLALATVCDAMQILNDVPVFNKLREEEKPGECAKSLVDPSSIGEAIVADENYSAVGTRREGGPY